MALADMEPTLEAALARSDAGSVAPKQAGKGEVTETT